MKRITLSMAGSYLSLRDNRSVRSWCKRHALIPFKDGRNFYLFEDHFFLVLNKIKGEQNIETVEVQKQHILFDKYKPKSKAAVDFDKEFNYL